MRYALGAFIRIQSRISYGIYATESHCVDIFAPHRYRTTVFTARISNRYVLTSHYQVQGWKTLILYMKTIGDPHLCCEIKEYSYVSLSKPMHTWNIDMAKKFPNYYSIKIHNVSVSQCFSHSPGIYTNTFVEQLNPFIQNLKSKVLWNTRSWISGNLTTLTSRLIYWLKSKYSRYFIVVNHVLSEDTST